MAKKKIKGQTVFIAVFLFVYFIIAARPVPREAILTPKWINSFETESPVVLGKTEVSGQLIPFDLGYNFGYIDTAGHFIVNRIKSSEIALSKNMWIEYPAEPENIEIKNIEGETIINIQNTRGYPILLDDRIFIFGSEQNSLSEIDRSGNVKWTYEFGSILTGIDVASDLVLAVSIDGVVEILNSQGERIYFFQPGGSRLEAIYGCAISKNGSRIGIVSGIDPQRFLLLEQFGTDPNDRDYRVIFHEFLDSGFRRPVRVSFIDEDARVVYERQGGIGCYNIKSRRSIYIPLNGEVTAIDESGDSGLFFLITRHIRQPLHRELVGIRLPEENSFINTLQNPIFIKAPFKSDSVYLKRVQTQSGSMLIVGGGAALASFDLEEK